MRMRLITISRYRGQLIMDIVFPIVFAAMPILIARANGDSAVVAFEAKTGTTNYVAYADRLQRFCGGLQRLLAYC
jgi:hypothetical protein